MTSALTPETERLVALRFPPEQQQTVRAILQDECGNSLPFVKNADDTAIERLRFAALKLSDADIAKLRAAVALAKTDWRDLLVAAGFANSPTAHRAWHPESDRD